MMRKVGQPEGQCVTVQRIFEDDRCVVRIDGFSKVCKAVFQYFWMPTVL